MRRFLSMVWFHLKLYVQNSYFVWLPITSTASVLLLQYLAAYAQQDGFSCDIWLRAAILGLWSSCTTAAGVIHYQRFQGTLRYLLHNGIGDRITLAALIVPASVFGSISFPIAWVGATLLGLPTELLSPTQIFGIFCYWLGCLVLDFLIAGFFVLTHNAILYEELIFIPLLLLAGVLPVPTAWEPIRAWFDWILPIGSATKLVLGSAANPWFLLVQFCVSTVLLGGIAYWLSAKILRAAHKNGEVSVLV